MNMSESKTTNEERLHKQIKDTFHKAFYDTVRQSLETQDYDHIVRLYTEIQDRLAKILKKNGRAHDRLLSDFDVAFFEQRLRNNAFDGNSMVSLVNTTFSWIHNLQMPLRDSATAAAKDRVMNSGTTLLEVVPVYIMECHKCIDTLHSDVNDFYENRDHPVVQEMLRRAAGL